ncbi:MAG: YbhB/YbcL family Raf kinase inhibitor-like protein [Bacteroidia bacterium]
MNIFITFIILTAMQVNESLLITSTAFTNGGAIPSKYTCDGSDVNPPLTIKNIPQGTLSLAVIMEDPDAANGTFDHWVLWNIIPSEVIEEQNTRGTDGSNGTGNKGYKGPCPPAGNHQYIFKVFALSNTLTLEAGSNKEALLNAMKDLVLAQGQLIGMYQKK